MSSAPSRPIDERSATASRSAKNASRGVIPITGVTPYAAIPAATASSSSTSPSKSAGGTTCGRRMTTGVPSWISPRSKAMRASATVENAAIPDRAWQTLEYIDAGDWPDAADAPGTRGGQSWQNRDGDLPRKDGSGATITYQEWDVNPKKRGQSRDAERIVTGSDGSAWYTGDHYETFERMR